MHVSKISKYTFSAKSDSHFRRPFRIRFALEIVVPHQFHAFAVRSESASHRWHSNVSFAQSVHIRCSFSRRTCTVQSVSLRAVFAEHCSAIGYHRTRVKHTQLRTLSAATLSHRLWKRWCIKFAHRRDHVRIQRVCDDSAELPHRCVYLSGGAACLCFVCLSTCTRAPRLGLTLRL